MGWARNKPGVISSITNISHRDIKASKCCCWLKEMKGQFFCGLFAYYRTASWLFVLRDINIANNEITYRYSLVGCPLSPAAPIKFLPAL